MPKAIEATVIAISNVRRLYCQATLFASARAKTNTIPAATSAPSSCNGFSNIARFRGSIAEFKELAKPAATFPTSPPVIIFIIFIVAAALLARARFIVVVILVPPAAACWSAGRRHSDNLV
jgi:hypothetical protein